MYSGWTKVSPHRPKFLRVCDPPRMTPSLQSSTTMPPVTPRSPKKHHSPHKRTKIVTGHEYGLSRRQLFQKTGVPEATIPGIVSRYRHQISAKSSPRSGRPPAISSEEIKHVLDIIDRQPFTSPKDLIVKARLTCCERTLKRALAREGIYHQPALRRPLLKDHHAKARLIFAQKHLRKPISWWRRVLFTDETTIARGDGERTLYVWCAKVREILAMTPFAPTRITNHTIFLQKDRLLPKNVQPKAKPTRHSQMFWAGFSWYTRSALTPLQGDPLAKKGGVSGNTIRALYEDVLPTVCEPGTIFLQDNAPTHTARVVQDFLSEFASAHGITILDWPPYSPDLNPIENLWKILKENIYKKDPELATLNSNQESKDRLIRVAVGCWHEIKEKVLRDLVKSMRRRMAAVIAAKGWYTKY